MPKTPSLLSGRVILRAMFQQMWEQADTSGPEALGDSRLENAKNLCDEIADLETKILG